MICVEDRLTMSEVLSRESVTDARWRSVDDGVLSLITSLREST